MSSLKDKKCVPCTEGGSALQEVQILRLLQELGSEWRVVDGHHLEKTYKFKNFKDALAFVNKLGQIAETEGHHPDLFLSWGKVKVTLSTHKVEGLTESDFILAAKFDAG